MNDTELVKREQLLKELIYSAGDLALSHFRQRKAGQYTLKGHQDFLTEADEVVEQHVRSAISARFPNDSILGEEAGGKKLEDPVWVIDPIDGTANFARGIEHFCISVAFYSDGKTQLGAIYNPVTDECYLARLNHYVSKNSLPISVSATLDMSQASIELGWSTRVTQKHYLSVMDNLLSNGANIRRGGSGALALAWVAEGRTDGYAELHMNAWDCLAGLLMVQEAGGYVGEYPDNLSAILSGGPIIATTPCISHIFSESVDIPLATSEI